MRRRLGIRTILCIFGEEARIKRFWCVFCVFFEREEKCVENIQAKSKTQKSLFFFGLGMPFEELEFDIKPWNMLFCVDFDLVWPLVKLGLTRGISAEKGTLGVPVFEQIAPRHFGCSGGPMERKWYFWIFRGLACKLTVDKIWYQHMVTSVSDSFSFSEFVFYMKTLLIIPIT